MTSIKVRLGWGLATLVVVMNGCSKSEVQGPAKEAPTGVAPATEQALQEEEAVSPAPPPGAAPPNDPWPQAVTQPRSKSGDERQQPTPAEPAGARKHKKDESGAASQRPSAPKATLGGRGSSADMEADDTVAVLERAQQATVDIDLAFERMAEALELAVPDCSAAERFRQNLCSLADHICQIEQELPTTTMRRCEDGKKRCADASKRYRTRCDG